MQKTSILLVMTLGVVPPSFAQTPATQVNIAEQQSRDAEKIKILQAELTEQKQLTADLQKKRAVQMADDNKQALVNTENRIEELNANIKQLEQEIALAEGRANKTVVVKPVTVPANSSVATAQKTDTNGPWWDLYNRPPQAAQ
jgi:hypothetical protein